MFMLSKRIAAPFERDLSTFYSPAIMPVAESEVSLSKKFSIMAAEFSKNFGEIFFDFYPHKKVGGMTETQGII